MSCTHASHFPTKVATHAWAGAWVQEDGLSGNSCASALRGYAALLRWPSGPKRTHSQRWKKAFALTHLSSTFRSCWRMAAGCRSTQGSRFEPWQGHLQRKVATAPAGCCVHVLENWIFTFAFAGASEGYTLLMLLYAPSTSFYPKKILKKSMSNPKNTMYIWLYRHFLFLFYIQ